MEAVSGLLACGSRCNSCCIPLAPLRLSLRSSFSSIFCELDVTLHHNSLKVEETRTRRLPHIKVSGNAVDKHKSFWVLPLYGHTTWQSLCARLDGSEQQVTSGQALMGVTLSNVTSNNEHCVLCYCCAAWCGLAAKCILYVCTARSSHVQRATGARCESTWRSWDDCFLQTGWTWVPTHTRPHSFPIKQTDLAVLCDHSTHGT